MCGSITFYGFNGKVREVCRYVAREDFIKEIKEAEDCGELCTVRVTSTDKSFLKEVKKILADCNFIRMNKWRNRKEFLSDKEFILDPPF